MQKSCCLNLDSLQPIFDFELYKVRAQDKEDVKQTAILRILKSMSRYDAEQLPEDKMFSFAQVIVKRTVVDYYRKTGRKIEQHTTLVNWCDDVEEETGSGGSGAFNTSVDDYGFDVADVRIDFYYKYQEFTPQERKVVDYLLSSEDGLGMNMSEISSMVGVDKSHASRALKKLRDVCAVRH